MTIEDPIMMMSPAAPRGRGRAGPRRSLDLLILCGRIALVSCVLGALYEAEMQRRDHAYVSALAQRIVARSHASTTSERIVALRDYLRAHIEDSHVADGDLPYLRAAASETLATGRGGPGDVARAFVDLAWAVGIPAQRLCLFGQTDHVAAEARLDDGRIVIVDGTRAPQIVSLETVDEVLAGGWFQDHTTLNLRRLHLGFLVSRVRLEIGWISYLAENPHLIKSLLWAFVFCALALVALARAAFRRFLHRRGWVHSSTLDPEGAVERNAVVRVSR